MPTEILFVSVAPPWGGHYFWDEDQDDGVRGGLFAALQGLGKTIRTCQEFWSAHYFLVPGVKCPSENNGKDHLPSTKARENCAKHLRSEVLAARPKRILALGRDAMATVASALGLDIPGTVQAYRASGPWWARVGDQDIPVAGTYFPGNDRHHGLVHIGPDIQNLLSLQPRTALAPKQWRSLYLSARINLQDLVRFGVLTGFRDETGFVQVQTPGPVTFWVSHRELASWIWPSDTVDPCEPKGK